MHPDQAIGSIAPDFIGLGYEISSVARPGLLSATNEVYVQLVRNLSRQGVIRIGGNTADYASYSPSAAAVSAPKTTVVNDEALRQLASFLDATGWRLIWGLDLGKGSVAEAVAEAKAVQRAAGSQLLAFEIGNEPDLFPHENIVRRTMATGTGSPNIVDTRRLFAGNCPAYPWRDRTSQ